MSGWCGAGRCADAGAARPAGDEPSPARDEDRASRIQRLIAELGHKRYSVRTQAHQQLADIGRPALEPLTEALRHADPEIRARALELLIELRGRGFLGIQLHEAWSGSTPVDVEDSERAEQVAESMPKKEEGADERFSQPIVVAAQVRKGMREPAELAGMEDGDKVLSVDGEPVRGMVDLMRFVIRAGPRKPSAVLVERGEEKMLLPVTFTRNPADAPPIDLLGDPADTDAPPVPNEKGAEKSAEETKQAEEEIPQE